MLIVTDGTLSSQVYRKPTHTDHYLQFGSHHPLIHKLGVIRTLHYRAETIVSENSQISKEKDHTRNSPRGGGHSTFFQVGVCGPDFRSVGLANWHLPLKRGACERKISKFGGLWAENFQIFGGLWAENFQIWGLVSWKFPNFGGLWAENFQIFSKGGLVNWLFCLKWDPCERQERREKGVFRAAHPHTPFLGQCPPPRGIHSRTVRLPGLGLLKSQQKEMSTTTENRGWSDQ